MRWLAPPPGVKQMIPPLSASGHRPKYSTALISVAMARQTPSGHCLICLTDHPSSPGAFPGALCQAALDSLLQVSGCTAKVS